MISLKRWFCLHLLIVSDKEYIGKRKKESATGMFKPDDKILSLTPNHSGFKKNMTNITSEWHIPCHTPAPFLLCSGNRAP